MAKHGKKPTRQQKKMISENGKNPQNWLVERETPQELVIIHRETGRLITFPKGA